MRTPYTNICSQQQEWHLARYINKTELFSTVIAWAHRQALYWLLLLKLLDKAWTDKMTVTRPVRSLPKFISWAYIPAYSPRSEVELIRRAFPLVLQVAPNPRATEAQRLPGSMKRKANQGVCTRYFCEKLTSEYEKLVINLHLASDNERGIASSIWAPWGPVLSEPTSSSTSSSNHSPQPAFAPTTFAQIFGTMMFRLTSLSLSKKPSSKCAIGLKETSTKASPQRKSPIPLKLRAKLFPKYRQSKLRLTLSPICGCHHPMNSCQARFVRHTVAGNMRLDPTSPIPASMSTTRSQRPPWASVSWHHYP